MDKEHTIIHRKEGNNLKVCLVNNYGNKLAE